MLDDLRKPDDELELDDAESLDSFAFSVDDAPEKAKFLGMTPVERMFISIFLFMNVLVLGLALLLATNRLG
jgi:hypothetical protein